MTVNFEAQENNQGILTFEIPQDQVQKGLDQAFKKVKKSVTVPGFRKGKVPRQIFNNVYGEAALYEEALNLLLPEAYEAAAKESGLDIVGQPSIDIESLEKGQSWVLKAQVNLKPEVKLGDYKNLKASKADSGIKDEEVQEALKQRQESMAELVLKESPAELGDTLVIDYEGSVDGVAFEGGQAENYSLELGSNSFIPGFEDQLVGAEVGQEVEVNVTFPEEYHAEDLAGQDAVFKVKVHEIKTKELPELDDEFAKDLDEEVESLDELTNKIRVQLEEEKEKLAQEEFEDAILRQAVENAEVLGGVPQVMVDEEVKRQVDYFKNNLQGQGISPQLYYQITGSSEEDLFQQYQEEAELRTKTNLVLEAIVKAEDFQVSDAEIDEEVNKLASQYNMEAEKVRSFVSEEMLASDIKMKKAMNIVFETAEVE